MGLQDEISTITIDNYNSTSTPWPENDEWHEYTRVFITRIVEEWLSKYANDNMRILNAGSGGTEYRCKSQIIHMDITGKCIRQFKQHFVGSIEKTSAPNASYDGIVCVGSVLNYADAQRAIFEFSRILKDDGFLILEFERSNSAEFILTKDYGKDLFMKEYHYNNQKHLLWMYSEKHIIRTLKRNHLRAIMIRRFHTVSTLLCRLGKPEAKAVFFAKYDGCFKPLSYFFSHNEVMLITKKHISK